MALPAIGLSREFLALFLQGEPPAPAPDAVIVRLMPPPSDLETLADILFKSLGLSGVLAVTGILLGIVLGWVVFWVRRYRSA
jgi:hypothetical protein